MGNYASVLGKDAYDYNVDGKELQGHNDPVNTLALTADAELLASGGKVRMLLETVCNRRKGDEILRIWDMKTRLPVKTPKYHQAYGQVTSVVWMARATENRNIIAFGTGLGWIVVWKHERLLVGGRVDHRMQLPMILRVRLTTYKPKHLRM